MTQDCISPARGRVIAIHGFMMSGETLRRQMGLLESRLSAVATLSFPDAPHTRVSNDPLAVHLRKQGARATRSLIWWSANDDGSVYEGWNESLASLHTLIDDGPPPILIGFSQGAIFAAALAALSAAGELPPLAAAVLIAGALPRAQNLKPFLSSPISIPLLHVWGDRDQRMGDKPAQLAAHLGGEQEVWRGAHQVPRTGTAADAIVNFVQQQL